MHNKVDINLLEEQSESVKIRRDYIKALCKVHVDTFQKDGFSRLTEKNSSLWSVSEGGYGVVSHHTDSAKVTRLLTISVPNLLDRKQVMHSFL